MSDTTRRQVVSAGVAATLLAGDAKAGAEAANTRLFSFAGGDSGTWSIVSMKAVAGAPLPISARLSVMEGSVAAAGSQWMLRGVTSNLRYTTGPEKAVLTAQQVSLGRPEATRGALIPIRKNAQWWSLAQDDRRKIFEESSHHTKTGLKYLPQIARRLHHCRDLGEVAAFDFLTYFDYSPEHAAAFDDLLAELRASEEWRFVDREVDIRLTRQPA